MFSSLADEMNHAMRYAQSEQAEQSEGRGATKRGALTMPSRAAGNNGG